MAGKNQKKEESISSIGVNSPSGYYAIPPLDKDGVKAMYQAFQNKENAADVIAKDGVNPAIAEIEYERYLSMKSRNPFDLQRRIISGIKNAAYGPMAMLIEKGKKKLLSNTELLMLIQHKTTQHGDFYVKNLVADPNLRLPDGLTRFKCTSCGQLEGGVIINGNTNAVFNILGMTYKCMSCRTEGNSHTI